MAHAVNHFFMRCLEIMATRTSVNELKARHSTTCVYNIHKLHVHVIFNATDNSRIH